MAGRGKQTVAPRAALPRERVEIDSAIFWMAFGVSALFVFGQMGYVLTTVPLVIGLFRQLGGDLTPILQFFSRLGPFGIIALLAAFDTVTFGVFALLARRYAFWLIFVPPVIYLGSGFVLVWLLASPATARILG